MRQFLIGIICVGTISIGLAQVKPERRKLPEASKAQISDLQRQVNDAKAAAEIAAARYEALQSRLAANIYRAMADSGLNTQDWEPRISEQNEIYFERKVAQPSPSPKKEDKK
jgi:hypothetical protein